MTAEEIQSVKDEILFWSNNCGGCETCDRLFGNQKEPIYDMQTVYEIICFFEQKLKKEEKNG